MGITVITAEQARHITDRNVKVLTDLILLAIHAAIKQVAIKGGSYMVYEYPSGTDEAIRTRTVEELRTNGFTANNRNVQAEQFYTADYVCKVEWQR